MDFMLAHPVLINRPIVVTSKGDHNFVGPRKAVLDILPNPHIGPFTKRMVKSSCVECSSKLGNTCKGRNAVMIMIDDARSVIVPRDA